MVVMAAENLTTIDPYVETWWKWSSLLFEIYNNNVLFSSLAAYRIYWYTLMISSPWVAETERSKVQIRLGHTVRRHHTHTKKVFLKNY